MPALATAASSSAVLLLLSLASVLSPSVASGDDDVLFAALVHRHGSRAPAAFLLNDSSSDLWPNGLGALTAKGVQQLHALGSALRTRYGPSGHGLLGDTHARHDLTYRCTDVERTIMSAQAVVQTLYPDSRAPVPLHIVAKADDSLLYPWTGDACVRYGVLQAEDEAGPAWEQLRQEHAHALQYIDQHFGLPNLNLPEMWLIADPLMCEAEEGLPWPAGVTQELYEEFVNMSDHTAGRMFATPDMRLLGSGVYVDMLYTRLVAASQGQVQPGWDSSTYAPELVNASVRVRLGPALYLYSAHDTTLAAVLSGLQLFDWLTPIYASSLVVELVNSSASGLSVRMYYNKGVSNLFNDSSIITLPNCDALCPLDTFLNYLEPYRLSQSQWTEECENEGKGEDLVVLGPLGPVKSWILSSAVGLVVGALLACFVYWLCARTVRCCRIKAVKYHNVDGVEGGVRVVL